MKKSKYKEMTITEASEYFDGHDIFEFEDIKEITDIKFKLQKKKYIGLDMGLFKKIQNKAKKLHKSEDALIQEWLVEKGVIKIVAKSATDPTKHYVLL